MRPERVEMPRYELDGRQRAEKCDAVARAFSRQTLGRGKARQDNLYSNDVSRGAPFSTTASATS